MKNKFSLAVQPGIPFFLFFLLVGCLSVLPSCKKDKFSSTGALSFSDDTITFDTIFTTLGSTTKFFTIRNTGKQALKISNIRLANGATSSYRINVDGDSGTSFNDVEIPAKDSIYVFVEVTVDPSSANLPFLILDAIQFTTNGNQQQVVLQAYGQNAHFFNADSIENNTVWSNDLPYVILNYLEVKQGASLSINPDCKVYFGGGAALLVEGELDINGTDTSHMVTFRGVRLDQDITGTSYDDFPGQYAGLFFLRNSIGHINYLSMRNSSYGINVGNIKTSDNATDNLTQILAMDLSNAANLTITNSKIYNNAFYGIFGFYGIITGSNLLVYNCGKNVVSLVAGGDYNFTNCTFYTRGSSYISHTKDPVFYMNNFFIYDVDAEPTHPLVSKALLTNCIVYGTLEEEIAKDTIASNPNNINLTFASCVVKTNRNISSDPIFNTCKIDDPQFKDVFQNDYRIKTNSSPCVDFSDPLIFTTSDIDGFGINGIRRDCGAYEFRN